MAGGYSRAMDAEALERNALGAIAQASDAEELDEARVRYLGRKSELKQALRDVRDRETGMVLNAVRDRIEQALADRESELETARSEAAASDGFDPTLPGEDIPRGSLHLITQLRRRIEDVFLGLGYRVLDGPEADTVEYNFDALNTSEAHPSRAEDDTFYLSDAAVLRPHTSPSQIRAMLEQEPPIYVVSLGRTYRRDTLDATHTPVFHQVECLAVDRGITLADLRGTMEYFTKAVFGGDRKARMRTSFFPFTEPSAEFDVTCYLCDGAGCQVCKHSGWIEMGGSGMVDPAVFAAVGYDPSEWSGFAFGLGIDRIAFLRHGLPDLRLFWENDIRFLSQF
jgi:phenylalanyl-tRNA synthetase alpha chain